MNKSNSVIKTEVITINYQGFPIKFKMEYFLPPNHSLSRGQHCCCSVQWCHPHQNDHTGG